MRKILIAIVLLGLSCISYSIYNPHSDKNVILANASSSCLSSRTFKQWYAFYGSTTINTLDSNEFFPSENYAYKIYEKATIEDAMLSLFLGLFTTISRKTVVVEYCDLNIQKSKEVTNKKEPFSEINPKLDKIIEKQDALEKEISSYGNMPINKTLPKEETDDSKDTFIAYMDLINSKLNEAEHRQTQLENEINYLKSLPTTPTDRITSIVEAKKPVENSELQELLKSSEQVILIRGKNQTVTIGPDAPKTQSVSNTERPLAIEKTYNKGKQEEDNPKVQDSLHRKQTIASVYFPFNSAKIGSKEKERIKKLFSQEIKNHTVLLVGYSDAIGNNDYNLKLSHKRAEVVKEEIKKLTSNGKIHVSAAGKSVGMQNNTSLQGNSSLQRRVDIMILDH